jgi:hypothetical protein
MLSCSSEAALFREGDDVPALAELHDDFDLLFKVVLLPT